MHKCSVADPHQFKADPDTDPSFHFNADPHPADLPSSYLMPQGFILTWGGGVHKTSNEAAASGVQTSKEKRQDMVGILCVFTE